jgi:hypothetical protein
LFCLSRSLCSAAWVLSSEPSITEFPTVLPAEARLDNSGNLEHGMMTSHEQQTGEHKAITMVAGGAGALVGSIAFMAVGLGAIAIPGIGPAITAAPLAVTIGSASIGAAAGGIVGALIASAADRQ